MPTAVSGFTRIQKCFLFFLRFQFPKKEAFQKWLFLNISKKNRLQVLHGAEWQRDGHVDSCQETQTQAPHPGGDSIQGMTPPPPPPSVLTSVFRSGAAAVTGPTSSAGRWPAVSGRSNSVCKLLQTFYKFYFNWIYFIYFPTIPLCVLQNDWPLPGGTYSVTAGSTASGPTVNLQVTNTAGVKECRRVYIIIKIHTRYTKLASLW